MLSDLELELTNEGRHLLTVEACSAFVLLGLVCEPWICVQLVLGAKTNSGFRRAGFRRWSSWNSGHGVELNDDETIAKRRDRAIRRVAPSRAKGDEGDEGRGAGVASFSHIPSLCVISGVDGFGFGCQLANKFILGPSTESLGGLCPDPGFRVPPACNNSLLGR